MKHNRLRKNDTRLLASTCNTIVTSMNVVINVKGRQMFVAVKRGMELLKGCIKLIIEPKNVEIHF